MSVKRNDPCPCGSGKKYKKCCGASVAAARRPPPAELLRQASEHHMAGRLADAEHLYRSALDNRATHASALHGLGVIAFQRERHAEACELIGQAIAERPDVALYHFNLGKACRAAGRLADATEAYRRALRVEPRHVPSLENLGNLLAFQSRFLDAADCFRTVVEQQRDNLRARRALGAALWRGGRLKEGIDTYRGAATGPMARLRLAIMDCATQSSLDDIAAVRTELHDAMDLVEAEAPLPGDAEAEIDVTCFYSAYHGGNERDTLSRLGTVLAKAFPALQFVAPHCRPSAVRERRAKPRIGIVSPFLGEHSVTRYLGAMLAGIDPERFELWIFTQPSLKGDTASALRERAARFVELQPSLPAMRSAIGEARLDLLVHADLGMMPLTYLLAFSRLAPVQATTFGHPVTSGVPAIDWYLSHAGVEAADASAHYSERLHLMPAGGTFCCFPRPAPAQTVLDREMLGVPGDAHLYLCPQNLLKIHPDFDPILRALLERDAKALVAFVSDKEDWRPRLEARHRSSLGALADRVIYLPYQNSRDGYFSLYRLCDAVLDPPHFSGGVTSFDAFAMGAPVVALPGRYFRGRQTWALYRRMEIDDCIARDADHYVDIALRLAADTAFRSDVCSRIEERNHLIFDDPSVIAHWNDALARLAAEAATGD
ncbi:MAG: tetratricopeptide repeat protein [Rhodocyclaceae bacterium]|nr:tetratricopeptide repeat protein [Rhodocyclaceae bacterium]